MARHGSITLSEWDEWRKSETTRLVSEGISCAAYVDKMTGGRRLTDRAQIEWASYWHTAMHKLREENDATTGYPEAD